jgi:anti-sigma factor RsiW
MKSTCRISRYLTAYVDDELSARRRAWVEKHLQRCPACAAELDSIRASDRILKLSAPPRISPERWRIFDRELSAALDAVDLEAARPARVREARPVERFDRRVAFATAGAVAVAVLALVVLGPTSWFGPAAGGNECIVDSVESYASGYTPMYFTSNDPEMTVIWVFAEETGPGQGTDGIGAR